MTTDQRSTDGMDWVTTYSALIEHELDNAAVGMFQDNLENLHASRRCILSGGADVDYEFWRDMALTLLYEAYAAKGASGDERQVTAGVRQKLNEFLKSDPEHRKHWAAEFADYLAAKN